MIHTVTALLQYGLKNVVYLVVIWLYFVCDLGTFLLLSMAMTTIYLHDASELYQFLNLLTHGGCVGNFKSVISAVDYVCEHFLWNCSHMNAPPPPPKKKKKNPDDQSTAIQVMAWWCQATRHYPSQYSPRSISPDGITRPKYVKRQHSNFSGIYYMKACFQ